jgi:hypothetical protein
MLKLTVIAVAAASFLAAAVGTASARNLSISNRNIRVVWNPLVLQDQPFRIREIRCRVTIEGSFHSNTITKAPRALIGYITRAIVQHPCTGGEAWVHNGVETIPDGTRPQSLPWHVTFENFSGTLPNITRIELLLRSLAFTIEVPGLCTGQFGEPALNILGRANLNSTHVVTSLNPNPASTIPGRGGCAGVTGGFQENPGTVTLLGAATAITITLI